MTISMPELSVQPNKFLFDYKILILILVVLIISIILACKKKTLRESMITLCVSDVIVAIMYICTRIYVTREFGYVYFFETNNDISELLVCGYTGVVLFLIVFLTNKVINRFKGGK